MSNLNRFKRGGPKSTNVFNDDDRGMSDRRRVTFAKVIVEQQHKEVSKQNKITRRPVVDVLQGRDSKNLSENQRLKIIRQSGLSDADSFIHETAIKLVEKAMGSGDASCLHSLFLAMPNGSRRLKLMAWIELFTPFAISAAKAFVRPEKRGNLFFDRAGATAKPFYVLT